MSFDINPPRRPKLWEAWTPFQLSAFALLLLCAELFCQMAVYRLTGDAFASSIVSIAATMVLPCGLAAWWHGETLVQAFELRPRSLTVAVGVAVGLLSWAPAAYLASLSSRLRPPSPEYVALLTENLPRTTADMIVAYLAVAVIAPLGEELIFRGLLFRALRARWGWPKAAILTALFFGVVHGAPWYLFGLVALGLLLALLYHLTRSLLAPVLAHASYNVVALTLMIRSGIGEEPAATVGMSRDGWTLLATSTALLAVLLTWLWRRYPREASVRPEDGWR